MVSTFAGGASAGNADGAGTDARFNSPNGLDVDRDGNVYVADAGNHRIRKISPEGMVSTIAGTSQGYQDGAAGTSMFNNPYGVAVAFDGTVYVADTGNHRIRRISTNGQVSNFAGATEGLKDGAAGVAQFRQPFSLTIDEADNLYVADAGNHAIRKITPAGVVSTVAGGTSGRVDGPLAGARFFVPNDVALDPGKRLFVADFNNHAIRKIDFGLQAAETVSGNGTTGAADGAANLARFNFPTGLAIDGQGKVWVADNQNHKIRTVGVDGTTATFAGAAAGFQDGPASQALFNEPTDIAIDRFGAIYIADTANHRIRRVR